MSIDRRRAVDTDHSTIQHRLSPRAVLRNPRLLPLRSALPPSGILSLPALDQVRNVIKAEQD